MTRQRLTKRQIKEDPLTTWIGNAQAWCRAHARHLMIGAAAVVLLSASIVAMRNTRSAAEEQAATQLSQAQYHLWGNNLAQAIDLTNDIEQRWPGTRSAHMAQLVRADAQLASGEAADALASYLEFVESSNSDEVVYANGLRGAAVALEDTGQYVEAARQYELLARQHDRGQLVAQDLISAGRCLARAGDVAGARRVYQEVLDEHPDQRGSFDPELELLELGSDVGDQS